MANSKTVLAIAAHPDDIEFGMAGTLLQLGQRGWELHYLNLASGNCGSARHNAAATRRLRRREAQDAARLLNASYHPPLVDDLEIFYCDSTLRQLSAIIRAVKPTVILTHAPQDYMEDHMTTSRLAVTAAFSRGMPNYRTQPRRTAIEGSVTIYHAMPHGLRDGLRRLVVPELFVETGAVHLQKRAALACHRSQKEWLDVSQGMDSYLFAMDAMSRTVGKMSRRFTHAEGWRRHSHLGFSDQEFDPLFVTLGKACRINSRYEKALQ